MKEAKKDERGNRKERKRRNTTAHIMTFKRREKELWEAKLKGGLCGTCRTLHDEESPCSAEHYTWHLAMEYTHKHKQLTQVIPGGNIFSKKKSNQENEDNTMAKDEGTATEDGGDGSGRGVA